MKSFKRALASILAVAMLATSVNVGFAANTNFNDVDSKYSTAVNRLASIDILKGYEDGSFKPEGTITRAEAAAVLVRMIGKEKLASYSTGLSQFSDMTGHWGNGYVNVAASAGIIIGYPDGSFGPENKVTYAEIVTMMVRSLGAGEAVGASGTWPSNYLNFAIIEGLTDDVAIIPNAPAVRGDVAKIASATLDAPMWKATGFNSDGTRTYAKTDANNGGVKTLFEEKLELTKHEMYTIMESLGNGSLDIDQFKAGKDGNDANDTIDANEISTFRFAKGLARQVIPGQEVDIWVNKDNRVIMIQHANDTKQTLVNFSDVTDVAASTMMFKLTDGTEKKYNLLAGTVYVIDGVVGVKGNINKNLDLSGAALLNSDNKVTHVYVTNYNKAMVVGDISINEKDNIYRINADRNSPYNDTRLSYDLDDDIVYVRNARGQQITLDDINEGDMILYTTNKNYLVVYPANIVEGTIDAEDKETLEVDGQSYKINPNFEGGSLISSVSIDDEVKMFLDTAGQIVAIEKTRGGSANGDYGVIVDMYDYTDEKGATKVKVEIFNLSSGNLTGLKLFDAEKTDEAGVVFTGEDFFNESNKTIRNAAGIAADVYADYVGKVVEYDVKSDKIILYAVDSDEIVDNGLATSSVSVSKEKFTIGGSNYYVESSKVKVYQAVEIDTDNVITMKELSFSSLKDISNIEFILVDFDDDKDTAAIVYVPMRDSADADNIVDTKQILNKSNDDNLGVITNIKALTGGDYKVTVMTNDGSVEFYVNKDEAKDIITTGFNGTSIRLDTKSHWSRFEGILVAFSTDSNDYVSSENIQFSNAVNVAKLYEVTSRDEVKMLNTSNVKFDIDSFGNIFVVESDITVSGAVAANGTITLVPANLDDGDAVVVAGVTFTYDSADNTGANFTTAEDLANDIDALASVGATHSGNVVTVVAATAGLAGNSITMTTTGDADEVTLSGARLAGGLNTNYLLKNMAISTASKVSEVSKNETNFNAAHADEANTVYYYIVEVDKDGDLVDLDASNATGTNTGAVAIMLFNPNEF